MAIGHAIGVPYNSWKGRDISQLVIDLQIHVVKKFPRRIDARRNAHPLLERGVYLPYIVAYLPELWLFEISSESHFESLIT